MGGTSKAAGLRKESVAWLRTTIMAAAAMVTGSSTAQAQDDSGFRSYMVQLRQQALAEGVSVRTADAVFPGLTLNPRVIELDRGQPGATNSSSAIPAFAPYKAQHVDTARIARGRQTYLAQRSRLQRIEQQTGVPESIMVAIWGHETNYGSYTGNFDLLRSLASLA